MGLSTLSGGILEGYSSPSLSYLLLPSHASHSSVTELNDKPNNTISDISSKLNETNYFDEEITTGTDQVIYTMP